METAERIALGMVDAERKRRVKVAGAEIVEIDGLVLMFSNLPDPALNPIAVERCPRDPERALKLADREFERRGHSIGIDLQVGRHPSMDLAVRSLGLALIIEQPAMAVASSDLVATAVPDGIRIEPVTDDEGARALVRVDNEAFGGDPEIAMAFYGAGSHGVDGSMRSWRGKAAIPWASRPATSAWGRSA